MGAEKCFSEPACMLQFLIMSREEGPRGRNHSGSREIGKLRSVWEAVQTRIDEATVIRSTEEMTLFTKGQPLVSKLAAVAKFGVLPGAMVAAVVYSPPDYVRGTKSSK